MEGRTKEAIDALRKAISLESELPYHSSYASRLLAEALTRENRLEEAVVAYRGAVAWDPVRKELYGGQPSLAMDYAEVLARTGRAEEAKAIYYWGLRTGFDRVRGAEDFPLLVVFDPEPGMTYWEYTPQRLIAAARMAKASEIGWPPEEFEEIHKMEPTWLVPVVYLALKTGHERPDLWKLAESLATTAEEKEWVREYVEIKAMGDDPGREQRYRDHRRKLEGIGVARRKASAVLEQARLELANMHQKVASGVHR